MITKERLAAAKEYVRITTGTGEITWGQEMIKELVESVEWLQPRFAMLCEHRDKTDEYVEALKAEVERLKVFEKADADRKARRAKWDSETRLKELEKYRQERENQKDKRPQS